MEFRFKVQSCFEFGVNECSCMCEVDATCACHVRAYRVPQDVFAASSQSPQPSVHKHAIDAPSLNSFPIIYLYTTQTAAHTEPQFTPPRLHVYLDCASLASARRLSSLQALPARRPVPPRATPRISAGTCTPIIGLSRARARETQRQRRQRLWAARTQGVVANPFPIAPGEQQKSAERGKRRV
jgi:hypothetical protein